MRKGELRMRIGKGGRMALRWEGVWNLMKERLPSDSIYFQVDDLVAGHY